MIRRTYRYIIRAVEFLTVVSIVVIVLFTALEVILRQFFNHPTIWTNEITTYLLVWFGLLGITYAYHNDTHISVDLVYRRLGRRTRRAADILTSILLFLFAGAVSIFGFQYWWMAYSRGWRHFGMLDVPMSWTRIAVPLTGLLLMLQVGLTLYDNISEITGSREPDNNGKQEQDKR